ncbi:MAG TPA: hypothetical protein VHB97_24465, partial [Polyangia bacterium]|nr:hypothetical protein [Polyangia bacterium]
MRKASLIVMLVPLFTGCVASSSPESEAVTAPSPPSTASAAAQPVTLTLTAPSSMVRGTSSPIVVTAVDVSGARSDVTSIVT